MIAKQFRDVVHGVEQMECVAGLDGPAMDVTEPWVKRGDMYA